MSKIKNLKFIIILFVTILAFGLICLINSSANSPIEISCCVAMFISSPIVLSDSYILINPFTVSFT